MRAHACRNARTQERTHLIARLSFAAELLKYVISLSASHRTHMSRSFRAALSIQAVEVDFNLATEGPQLSTWGPSCIEPGTCGVMSLTAPSTDDRWTMPVNVSTYASHVTEGVMQEAYSFTFTDREELHMRCHSDGNCTMQMMISGLFSRTERKVHGCDWATVVVTFGLDQFLRTSRGATRCGTSRFTGW